MLNRKRIQDSSRGIVLGLVAGVSLATSASALTIDPSNSGLNQAVGCSDSSCLTTKYGLAAPAPVTGSLGISGGILTFNIQLASATLNATGGSDGGVTSVSFSNTIYSGSVDVTFDGANFNVDAGQFGSVDATLTPTGEGAQTSMGGNQVLVTGLCSGSPGSALQCGLIFGPQTSFSADVNGNLRYFRHTVDALAQVPEPGTAVLIGAGLVGLGLRRSREEA